MSIYIGLITQNSRQNIDELTSVAHHFDGLAAIDHYSTDGTHEILESRKGDGFVVQLPYYGHHGWSMNGFLFHPKVEDGTWILLRDSSERISETFAQNIRQFVAMLENNGINSVYQYSKLLLFKRFPHQQFGNTPHWGLQGAHPNAIQIDQTGLFKSDEEYCYSVRNRRPLFHWVGAYLRYYLLHDSNHCLLGLKDQSLFPARDAKRSAFRQFVRARGYPVTIDGVKALFSEPLDDETKAHINAELILHDYYRHEILGDTTLTDKHDPSSIRPIT